MAPRVRVHTRLLLSGEVTAFERTIDASADPVQAAFEELMGEIFGGLRQSDSCEFEQAG